MIDHRAFPLEAVQVAKSERIGGLRGSAELDAALLDLLAG